MLSGAPLEACHPWGAQMVLDYKGVLPSSVPYSVTWVLKWVCFFSASRSLPETGPATHGSHLLHHRSSRSRKGPGAISIPLGLLLSFSTSPHYQNLFSSLMVTKQMTSQKGMDANTVMRVRGRRRRKSNCIH